MVFERRRPYFLIASIAFIFLSSYYFSYMICLLLVGYCAIRVFQLEERVTHKSIFWLVRAVFRIRSSWRYYCDGYALAFDYRSF